MLTAAIGCLLCCCVGGVFSGSVSTGIESYVIQYFARLAAIPAAIYLTSVAIVPSQPHPFVRESGMYILGFHELGYRFLRMLILPVEMDVLVKWILLIAANAVATVISWGILQKRLPWVLSLLTGGRNRKALHLK